MEGNFTINGASIRLHFSPDATLLSVLRDSGYKEVKEGCREGQCGACVILLDGKLVNSCQVLAATTINRELLTVRGLGNIHALHPIQIAFMESGALQCGYCTPGMILATYYLLMRNPHPHDKDIKRALDGNLCRCTGYVKIIEAVKLAAAKMA